jgi:hypothetical protein
MTNLFTLLIVLRSIQKMLELFFLVKLTDRPEPWLAHTLQGDSCVKVLGRAFDWGLKDLIVWAIVLPSVFLKVILLRWLESFEKHPPLDALFEKTWV